MLDRITIAGIYDKPPIVGIELMDQKYKPEPNEQVAQIVRIDPRDYPDHPEEQFNPADYFLGDYQQAINVRIAEIMGWIWVDGFSRDGEVWFISPEIQARYSPEWMSNHRVPNMPYKDQQQHRAKEKEPDCANDLNAIHAAVLWLKSQNEVTYNRYRAMTSSEHGVDATALQRAEKFLLVTATPNVDFRQDGGHGKASMSVR